MKQIVMFINPPYPPFSKGGINDFLAEIVKKLSSPFEKGGLRGILNP
jgi:hypothetical protein